MYRVASAMSRVRFPYPFQWGYPIFCAQDCFAMMAASFASLIEVCTHLQFCTSVKLGLYRIAAILQNRVTLGTRNFLDLV